MEHPWIEYYDIKLGHGFCEPEAYIEFENRVLIVECKRTGCVEGLTQMQFLYAPLIHHILKKPIQMLQICHFVTKSTPVPFVNSIEEFLQTDQPYGTWHYLGE